MSDRDEPGVEAHERAVRHRERALITIENDEQLLVAVVHALLAIEARIEELTVHLIQSR